MLPPWTPKRKSPTFNEISLASLQAFVAGGGLWFTAIGTKPLIADLAVVRKTLGGPNDSFHIIARISDGSLLNWGKFVALGLGGRRGM
jgi:hypothetical protein